MFNTDDADGLDPGEKSRDINFSNRRKPATGDGAFLPNDSPNAARNMAKKIAWMDSAKGVQLHQNLMGHYIREIDRQAENRMQMAMDEDFYDHIQFTDEELEILADRGQAPLIFNMIHTSVDWVLGSQRRATMDYRILAKNSDGVKSAERKTQLMKHVSDANHFESQCSDAFKDAVKAGLGWLEAGQGSEDDNSKVLMRSESWRSMLYDSTAVRYDLEDARYIMRAKWLDTDIAMGLWGRRRGMIDHAATTPGSGMFLIDDLGDDPMDTQELDHFLSYGGTSRSNIAHARRRIRIVECWFKKMVPDAAVMKGGQFHGELFDPWSIGHVMEYNKGAAVLSTRPRQIVHCALMTETGLLDIRRSPYRHNRYPFTPLWGYRRARDNMPYGLIRGVRDIQRDLNARAAKSLHHLSTTRVMMEEGSVDDPETVRNEAARPDSMIVYKAGHPPPDISTDREVASAHVDMMARDAEMIQQVSGVTNENLGQQTNATSGKAILARQDQGALTTSLFFDNLRRTRELHGEKTVILIEQSYTERDQFRITDSRGNPDFVYINDGDNGNAIAAFKADFSISEEDWRATARQARAEQLLDLARQLAATAPQMVVGIMDLLLEALDVPKGDEMVRRIRAITGQEDPDADPNNPTPEEQKRQEQAKAKAEIEQRGVMAELAIKEGEAAESQAKAQKTAAEAQVLLAEIQQKQAMGSPDGQDGPGSEIAAHQMAFEAELRKLREQALKQTAQYEQKLAEAKSHADAAFRAVELEKARILAETNIEKAMIDKEADIAVAKIKALTEAEKADAHDEHMKDMELIKTQAGATSNQSGDA